MLFAPNSPAWAEFTTRRFDTGVATNADSTPTGTLVKNGTDDGAVTVTITNVTTGVYKASWTIPSGYIAGDVVELRIAATVNSVADKEIVWRTRIVAFDPNDGAGLGLTNLNQSTGSIYTRLGAPAGASIAADLASIKQDTIPVFRGYAVSGSANTIILAPGSVEFDDQYAGMIATVVAGTGRRQSGKIMATSASTHSLTLDEPTGVLDGTSLIEITTAVLRDLDSRLSVMQAKMTDLINALANNTLTLASTAGVAVSGTVSTIVLAVGASAVDDFYNGWLVTIADTTGNTFIGFVSDYVGATRTLHVVRSTWAAAFAGTIIYGLVQKVFVAYAYDQDGNDIPTAEENAIATEDLIAQEHGDGDYDQAGGGSAIGEGSEDVRIVVRDTLNNPIADADVWVTSTNDPDAVVVAGALRSAADGSVSFLLDPGTFYVWRQKSGVNFTNPQTIVVEDA